MMINTPFYTVVLMILYSILRVMSAAEPTEPCPSNLGHIVANMCTNESTVEEKFNGYEAVDSVLLRITKQQNNCTCHVSLQNNVTNYTIYMSKYKGQSSAAPEQQNCGLAVDVEYMDTLGITESIQSINCTSGTSKRSIALNGNELKFRSRVINGDFTRGYCMQIYRDQAVFACTMNDQFGKAGKDGDWIETSGPQQNSFNDCKQYCQGTEACVAVHYDTNYCFVYNSMTTLIDKDNSTYSQKHCVDTQKLKIKCYASESTTQTSQRTTTEDNSSTKTETVTTPISNDPLTNLNSHSTMMTKKEVTKDKNSDLYVYIGAGAGGLLMILLIVCIIVCIRKRVKQTTLKEPNKDSTKQFCREDRDSDNDYGGLKDNVLYVSSEPNEVLEDGNYNTVDLEQTRTVNQDINLDGNYSTVDGICSNSSLSKSKPDIKPKQKTNSSLKRGSDEETIHLSTMDNSNNEYAVVDKGRNSDAVKHINPEHGNDTEYAVVNKVRKSSNKN